MLKAISYKSRFSLTKKQASRSDELVKLVQYETISVDFGFHGQSFWLPVSLKSPLKTSPLLQNLKRCWMARRLLLNEPVVGAGAAGQVLQTDQ